MTKRRGFLRQHELLAVSNLKLCFSTAPENAGLQKSNSRTARCRILKSIDAQDEQVST